MAELSGKKIAFLATDMVEQIELTEPWKAVEEASVCRTLVQEFAAAPARA
jgi:protease I